MNSMEDRVDAASQINYHTQLDAKFRYKGALISRKTAKQSHLLAEIHSDQFPIELTFGFTVISMSQLSVETCAYQGFIEEMLQNSYLSIIPCDQQCGMDSVTEVKADRLTCGQTTSFIVKLLRVDTSRIATFGIFY